jgi:hypothetical protein
MVREQPENAYELSFLGQLMAQGHFTSLILPGAEAEPPSQ